MKIGDVEKLEREVTAAITGQPVQLLVRQPEVFVHAHGPLAHTDALKLAILVVAQLRQSGLVTE